MRDYERTLIPCSFTTNDLAVRMAVGLKEYGKTDVKQNSTSKFSSNDVKVLETKNGSKYVIFILIIFVGKRTEKTYLLDMYHHHHHHHHDDKHGIPDRNPTIVQVLTS